MTEKAYSEGDIVEVRCLDIRQDSTWSCLESIRRKKPPPAKAVGYFLKEDDSCLIILSMYLKDDEDEDAGYIIFPKEMIKSVDLIQESELDDFIRDKK